MARIMISVPELELSKPWWPVYAVFQRDGREQQPTITTTSGGGSATTLYSSTGVVKPYDDLSMRFIPGMNLSLIELRFWNDTNVPLLKWIFKKAIVQSIEPFVPFSKGVPFKPSEKVTWAYELLKYEYYEKGDAPTWQDNPQF